MGWVMFGADPDVGSSAVRLWVAAGSASLLVFVCALAVDWTQTRVVRRIGVILVGAFLGGTLAWAFLDAATVRDQREERRALEARAVALNVQSLAPGSPLACLNGLAGDDVEAACERALFVSAATVASATSYASARLALLDDIVAYTKRGGSNIDDVLVPLRRSLETDRFGFVAHVLAMRDGCTSENCKALASLHDASRVRANLSGQTLSRYLDRYVTAWTQQSPAAPLADATSSIPGQPAAPGTHKVVDIDFPTAASIPAISIMNPEPKAAPEPPVRQSRKAADKAAAPAPAVASTPGVDPVWLPGTATTAPVPPASAAPGAQSGAPVQLSPSAAPPPTRAQ